MSRIGKCLGSANVSDRQMSDRQMSWIRKCLRSANVLQLSIFGKCRGSANVLDRQKSRIGIGPKRQRSDQQRSNQQMSKSANVAPQKSDRQRSDRQKSVLRKGRVFFFLPGLRVPLYLVNIITNRDFARFF